MPAAAAAVGAYGIIKSMTSGNGSSPGDSGFSPNDYQKTSDYDPNAFQYGGQPGGAQQAEDQYGSLAQQNQNKQAEYGAQQQNLYNAGVSGLNQANQDYGNQSQVFSGLMGDAGADVNGTIAGKAAALQAGQLAAGQQSLAASARGPAALALAQQQAAAGTSAGQAQIANQLQVNAAQEKLNALQAAGGMANTMRAGSQNQAQTAFGAGAQSGNLGIQSGQLGLGYNQLQSGVAQAQMQGQMANQQMMAQQHSGGQQLGAATQEANAQNNWKPIELTMGAMGSAGSAMGAMAGGGGAGMSDPMAKTDISEIGGSQQDLSGPLGGDHDGDPDVSSNLADKDGEPDVTSGKPSAFAKSTFGDQAKQTSLKMLPGAMGQLMPDLGTESTPAADALRGPLGMPGFGVSDPKSKADVKSLNPDADAVKGALPLGDMGPFQLSMSDTGRGSYKLGDMGNASQGGEGARPSLAGPAPKYSHGEPARAASAPSKAAERKMTPEEMSAWADKKLAEIKQQSAASLAAGPAVRRMESGTPETNYETELTPGAEAAYQHFMGHTFGDPELGDKYAANPQPWSRQSVMDLPGSGTDYDYRGAFAAGETPNASGHWTDQFKKPNHPTFSDESQYQRFAPNMAGSWQGENYQRNPQRPPQWLENEMEGEEPESRSTGGTQSPEVDPEGWTGEDSGPLAQASDPETKTDVGPTDEKRHDEEQFAQSLKELRDDRRRVEDPGAPPVEERHNPAGFINEWGSAIGNRIGRAINNSPTAQRIATPVANALGAYGQWVADHEDHPAALPAPAQRVVNATDQVVHPAVLAVGRGADAVAPGLGLKTREQMANEQKMAELDQQIKAAKAAQQTPIDMGEVDQPAPAMSDPRGKLLGGEHDNEVAAMLDATPAVSYRYKSAAFEPNAQRPGEKQVGFLTSDLKKTPMGASVVEKRPDGFEGYNQHRMIGLEFAGLRNVHERLRDLEARIAQKGQK